MFYLAILVSVWGCSQKKETYLPQSKTLVASVYASGLVKAKNQFMIYATATGVLKKCAVVSGDTVTANQPLFYLDNLNAQLGADNARAALDLTQNNKLDKIQEVELLVASAREKLALDESVYQRQKRLWEQKIGSELEFEQKKLAFVTSKLNYDNALNKLSQLKKSVETEYKRNQISYDISNKIAKDYTVSSPFKGRIYDVFVKEGMLITPQTALAVMGETNSYYVELEIDENDMLKIELGQQVLLTMDSYKGQVFEALITQINPLMNERNRTFTVEATFKKLPPKLYPNLTVEANIVVETKKNVLTIPKNYILKGDSVWVSEKLKRKIILGISDYENVEVISGLKKNEAIYKP